MDPRGAPQRVGLGHLADEVTRVPIAGVRPPLTRRSGGQTLVSVVQATDLWYLDHLADLGRHHRARSGRVLAERQMRA